MPSDPTPTDVECPLCSRHMMVRTASTGVFLSCSGYSLPPKEKCKGTINLQPGDEFVQAEQEKEIEAGEEDTPSDDGSEGQVRELLSKKKMSKMLNCYG